MRSNAQRKYPWLLDTPTSINPQKKFRGWAEVWKAGDEGSPAEGAPKRPNEIPLGKSGVEMLDEDMDTEMYAGEVISHISNDPTQANADPKIVDFYNRFKGSITRGQEDRMLGRYHRSQREYGESRSYADWKEHSGLPGEFRAYPFKQWDKENNGDYTKDFTSDQRGMLDEMMDYLRTQKR